MNKIVLRVLVLILLGLPTTAIRSQSEVPAGEWLPKGQLFPSLLFDDQEARTGGSLYGFNMNGEWQNRAFANFSAGLRRNIYRWNSSEPAEIGFELSVNTQFLFEQPFEFFQVNLFSVDFKVGVHYQKVIAPSLTLRGRLYHVSSHLGDDFIYRYFIHDFLENKRIYEVIDLGLAYNFGNYLMYGQIGVIAHTAYERKPLLFQAGCQWQQPVRNKDWLSWLAGVHIRSEQESNFYPAIHAGSGIIVGNKNQMPFTIMFDIYHGYLPHSLYDKTRITWLGGSLLFHPF
jgi:hypothetical protein